MALAVKLLKTVSKRRVGCRHLRVRGGGGGRAPRLGNCRQVVAGPRRGATRKQDNTNTKTETEGCVQNFHDEIPIRQSGRMVASRAISADINHSPAVAAGPMRCLVLKPQ